MYHTGLQPPEGRPVTCVSIKLASVSPSWQLPGQCCGPDLNHLTVPPPALQHCLESQSWPESQLLSRMLFSQRCKLHLRWDMP